MESYCQQVERFMYKLCHFTLITFIISFSFFDYKLVGYAQPLLAQNIDQNTNDLKYPVILIPGLGGAQAYCELKAQKSTIFSVWLNLLYLMLPEKMYNYFALRYDQSTLDAQDTDTCRVVFPGWGHTSTVEYLQNSGFRFFNYFGSLVQTLTMDKYFVKNFTIRAAPYDFRRLPYENSDFMERLKLLVEETYENGQQRPVVLIGHSMGSLYTLNFLNKQTKEWKQKYVKSYISVSAPFGGSVKALLGITSGYEVMMKARENFITLSPPADVPEVYCIYSSGLVTMKRLVYKPAGIYRDAFPNQAPVLEYGDGDGTVNLESLEVCTHWPDVKIIHLPASSHVPILADHRFVQFVQSHVTS
ncbi:unnamed protein product [Trichobilharzia szidati]|nr:unnamed protein product [Trichobilharzia szidati]